MLFSIVTVLICIYTNNVYGGSSPFLHILSSICDFCIQEGDETYEVPSFFSSEKNTKAKKDRFHKERTSCHKLCHWDPKVTFSQAALHVGSSGDLCSRSSAVGLAVMMMVISWGSGSPGYLWAEQWVAGEDKFNHIRRWSTSIGHFLPTLLILEEEVSYSISNDTRMVMAFTCKLDHLGGLKRECS